MSRPQPEMVQVSWAGTVGWTRERRRLGPRDCRPCTCLKDSAPPAAPKRCRWRRLWVIFMMDDDVLHWNAVGGRLPTMLLPERELDSEGLRFGPRDTQTHNWFSVADLYRLNETRGDWLYLTQWAAVKTQHPPKYAPPQWIEPSS